MCIRFLLSLLWATIRYFNTLFIVVSETEGTYLTNEDFGVAAQWRRGTLKALNRLDDVVNV